MSHQLGAELHMQADTHHHEENDFSRDMGASLGFSPSPDRPLRKGMPSYYKKMNMDLLNGWMNGYTMFFFLHIDFKLAFSNSNSIEDLSVNMQDLNQSRGSSQGRRLNQ